MQPIALRSIRPQAPAGTKKAVVCLFFFQAQPNIAGHLATTDAQWPCRKMTSGMGHPSQRSEDTSKTASQVFLASASSNDPQLDSDAIRYGYGFSFSSVSVRFVFGYLLGRLTGRPSAAVVFVLDLDLYAFENVVAGLYNMMKGTTRPRDEAPWHMDAIMQRPWYDVRAPFDFTLSQPTIPSFVLHFARTAFSDVSAFGPSITSNTSSTPKERNS